MRDILIFVVGFLGGMVGMALSYEHSFRLATNIQRTGRVDPKPPPDRQPVVSASPEASANLRVTEDAIRIGADAIQEAAQAEGMRISRKEAEHQARAMLGNADPLGGAH